MADCNFLTAKEMYNITKAKRDKLHEEWLEKIQQGILACAKNGHTSFTFSINNTEDAKELRNIYEPLGYITQVYYECGPCDLYMSISWNKE